MELNELYSIFKHCGVVTTDSRNTPRGAMFIALKGDNFNGNSFAKQAIDSGCSYALVDEKEYATNERIILVNNCLETLQQLAKVHRETLNTPIIAVTGTNGKTTTKELMAACLAKKFNTLYTKGNLNNHIGVPLTLLQLKPSHQLAVIEMGANHPKEIETLVNIAQPNYGIITNVGKAHLEGFGSLEGVLNTKCELYDYLRNHNGHLFRESENSLLAERTEGIEETLYGKAAGLYVSGTIHNGAAQLRFTLTHKGEAYPVDTQLIGGYNLPNALAAAAVALHLGVEVNDVVDALTHYTPQNNRSQLTQTAHNTLVVDAYNANPTSMRAALENFATLSASPKGVILGEMRELGEESEAEHQAVVAWLAAHPLDRVVLVGNAFCQLNPPYNCYATVAELCKEIALHPIEGETLLIKGSRGVKLEQCIKQL